MDLDYIDYGFDESHDWLMDLVSVLMGFVIVGLVAVVMYSVTLGFVAWSLAGVKPKEPVYPYSPPTVLYGPSTCLQACPSEPDVQPAAGYKALDWELK